MTVAQQHTSATRDATIASAIEGWFTKNARDLPWRRQRTPWRSLVSELMLQQTQVARVVERFEPFMTRFPTPEALADADEQDVLSLWQGLGYYRRARNLQAAAREIVDRLGGEVPVDAPTLLTLPGVGRYTAGSIASIVGGHREAIVDGNVARVLARLDEDDAPANDAAFMKRSWTRAESLVQACDDPSLLNEGLMELGALVCLPHPKTPACAQCPVRAACGARASNRTADIPRPRARPSRPVVHQHAVIVRRRGRVLVERRADTGLWPGLWQVPTREGDAPMTHTQVRDAIGLALESLEHRGSFTRTLTHRVVHVEVYEGCLEPGSRVGRSGGRRWVTRAQLAELPLSAAARRVLDG